jgi:beta-galactosidase
MVEVHRKRIVIDGRARILLSGEVHYFRLDRADWADRIDALAAAGCDTVASYIPWLCHETPDGAIDLDGHTRPELDLGAFIDLCADRGLYFVARPGPFVMAELKNEGLPFRLYDEHPEICPVTWDGEPVPSRTVDYLAPAFLSQVRRWYAAVMPILASRLVTRGGNVIAVQLDNEIGMLSWVTKAPDLTDNVLADFGHWLTARYDAETLARRYPFRLDDPAVRARGVRSPDDDYAPALTVDLGRYMRHRFARYVATLRQYAEAEGVCGVPFVVNIHGTGGGRGAQFPIGISQLMESYAGVPGMVSGSDHYLGDLTTDNAVDLYLINAFMDAVHDADQPLTSVEFEAGDGDYARDLAVVYDPSAIDLKTRLCVAQGNRLLNFYLFAGGVNPRLATPVGDGNDRISFTGERHGVGAPVGPEGQLGRSYQPTAAVAHAVRRLEAWLATMDEEHDDLAMAFVPDLFLTDTAYPSSARARAIVENLERHRFGGPGQRMARALLLAGYRFGAVTLPGQPDVAATPVLALGSPGYLDEPAQRALVDYLCAGGHLLLCGEVPSHDLEGRPCTALRDALGLAPRGTRVGDNRFFLSVRASGWMAPRPEERVSYAQLFDATRGTTILTEYDSGAGCGFEIEVGRGRAVVVTTDYPSRDVAFYRAAVERLGVSPGLRHDAAHANLLLTSTANDKGERFVHVLNLDGYDATFRLHEHGRALFGGHPVSLRGRQGVMLPLDLHLDGARLCYATAEILALDGDAISFPVPDTGLVVALETARTVVVDAPAQVRQENGLRVVRVTSDRRDARVTLRWA